MFIFPKFLSFIFFWHNWSQNLNFSTLTEIWYRHALLYAYYNFNVYFSKFLSVLFFWTNLVPRSEVPQINWNLVQGYVAIYFDFKVCFFKIFVIFFGRNLSQNLKFSKLTEIWYRYTLLYAYYNCYMLIFRF